MMPFAADHLGRPVFFISSMAMHTQNLRQDPRSSLLVTQPGSTGDPLGAARLTLIGTAEAVPPQEVRDLYVSHHESSQQWQEYTDFAYYRLGVEGVYFIGGFGVMGWITVEDYAAAAPDPLTAIASEIIQHMNEDHGDALRRIAEHHLGEAPEEAWMTAVDHLGFHLRLRTAERVYGRRIAFPREVRNKDEARATFMEMLRASS